jgi:hypothetical protein
LPPEDLFKFLERRDPEQRNMCCIVQPYQRIHMYFDLDWNLKSTLKKGWDSTKKAAKDDVPLPDLPSLKDPKRVFAVFLKVLQYLIERDFNRKLDLTETILLDASRPQKFSMHFHVLSQGWDCVASLNCWMKTRYGPYVAEKAAEGDADCLHFRVCNKREFKHLVDLAVYSDHRLFRGGGCRKPGSKPLEYVDWGSTVKKPESFRELLFATLINYRLPTKTEADFQFGHQQPADSSPVDRKTQLKQRRALNDEQIDSVRTWLSKVKIDKLEQLKFRQPEFDYAFFTHGSNRLPGIGFQAQTAACLKCSLERKKFIAHKSNRSFLWFDYDKNELVYDTMDDHCRGRCPYRFPVPKHLQEAAHASLPSNSTHQSVFLREMHKSLNVPSIFYDSSKDVVKSDAEAADEADDTLSVQRTCSDMYSNVSFV